MTTPKYMVAAAIKAINEVFDTEKPARLIDWSLEGDGYAIAIDGCLEAYDVMACVHGKLPRGTFLEPINNASLRLVRC